MTPCWYLINCQCQLLLLFHIYFKNILVFVEEQLANAPISAATHLAVALVNWVLSQWKKRLALSCKKNPCLKDHPTFTQGLLYVHFQLFLEITFVLQFFALFVWGVSFLSTCARAALRCVASRLHLTLSLTLSHSHSFSFSLSLTLSLSHQNGTVSSM